MRTLIAACLGLAFHLPAQGATGFLWAGVDLGLVHTVGPDAVPGRAAWPASDWAATSERVNRNLAKHQRDTLSRSLKMRSMVGDAYLDHHQTSPQTVVPHLERQDTAPMLTQADIAARVASYPRTEYGTGAVLIADQWNASERQGCYWLTFFDTDTGVVRQATHQCGAPSAIASKDVAGYWLVSARRVLEEHSPSQLPPHKAPSTYAQADAISADRLAQALELAREESTVLALRLELDEAAAALPAGIEPAECQTFYGVTACGYDCKTARRAIACSTTPGGTCVVRFGEVHCSP